MDNFEWSTEGLASAAHNGIEYAEAIDALESTRQFSIHFPTGGWFVVAPAETGRFITVWCDRVRGTAIYHISSAQVSSEEEVQAWEQRWSR